MNVRRPQYQNPPASITSGTAAATIGTCDTSGVKSPTAENVTGPSAVVVFPSACVWIAAVMRANVRANGEQSKRAASGVDLA